MYGPTDPVVVLDEKNFKKTVLNSDHIWVVEFYAQWCGHCQHFAPTYKEFAISAKRMMFNGGGDVRVFARERREGGGGGGGA